MDALERGEGGVPLVEVKPAYLDAHRRKRAHPTDAEQQVLRQAKLGGADVQTRCDPAGRARVLRPVAVQQIERDAADIDAPDLGAHTLAADRHSHGQRRTVGAADERRRKTVRVGVDPVLVLEAVGVDALAEVALAVEQADPDERQGVVGSLFEEVPGERSQASRVDRQRAMHAELGAEERAQARGHARVDRRRTRKIGRERRLGAAYSLQQLAVVGGPRQRLR